MAKTNSQPSTCRRCGHTLPPVAQQHGDPYCSSVCCKADHDVVDKVPKLSKLVALPGTAVHRETQAA